MLKECYEIFKCCFPRGLPWNSDERDFISPEKVMRAR